MLVRPVRDQRWWYTCSPKRRAEWLLGQLWHCTDIVPSLARQEFEDEGSDVSTYARLVRLLAQDLRDIRDAGPRKLTHEQEQNLSELMEIENLRRQV